MSKKLFLKDMKVGLRYKVLESTECETFQKGDIVGIYDNGDIFNKNAGGWIVPEKSEEFMETVEVEFSPENNKGLIKDLSSILEQMKELGYTEEMIMEIIGKGSN